jgi:large subunit ribosomal protein L4
MEPIRILLSARNIPTVALTEVKSLNIFEIMNCKKLVLSEAAVKAIESNFSSSSNFSNN